MPVEDGLPGLDVSRETLEKLLVYLDLLEKWNPSINLVARSTLADGWDRHIADSAQVLLQEPVGHDWVDLGSGAGFPGLVCAIISAEISPGRRFTLVEADNRKAQFLRTVSRETNTPITVKAQRIEVVPPLQADVITARAFAPLDRLLESIERHMRPEGVALLLKGRNFQEEIDAALERWSFQTQISRSRTSPEAVVIKINEVRRAA